MADTELLPDIVEQARQHAASFEAIGGTVAYPFSVRLARYVVLQHEELERLRRSPPIHDPVREEMARALEAARHAMERLREANNPFSGINYAIGEIDTAISSHRVSASSKPEVTSPAAGPSQGCDQKTAT